MRRFILILAVAVFVVGCGGGGDGDHKTASPTASDVQIPGAKCVFIVIIDGKPIQVSGAGGSTVTVGNITFTFNLDCSKVTTTTSTTSALAVSGSK